MSTVYTINASILKAYRIYSNNFCKVSQQEQEQEQQQQQQQKQQLLKLIERDARIENKQFNEGLFRVGNRSSYGIESQIKKFAKIK